MSSDEDFFIGIDLGTSNSVACVYINNEPTPIPSSEGVNSMYGPSFPSFVAFEDNGSVIVGEAAKNKYTTQPERVVSKIKKDMGKDTKIEFNGQFFSPQEISAYILDKIKNDAEEFLENHLNRKITVENAVITVPAYFDDNQRTATKDAAEIAGLKATIINEPTAASLAYGIKNINKGLQRILVFDLGAGTFDVTIMEYANGIFKVKATSGDTDLGGTDMDNILSNYLVKEFEKQHGVELNLSNHQIRNMLTDAAEKAKIQLSNSTKTEVNLPYIGVDSNNNPLNLITTVTRNQLEDLVRPIVNRCEKPLQRALDDSGFTKRDITKLILVGGPTRMPIVRDFVENFMSMKAEKGIDPMICVAQGASIKGGVEKGEITVIKDIFDVIPLSLGLISEGGLTQVLIKRNSEVPISKSQRFKTVKDDQSFIKIEIVQGEFGMAKENSYLGAFVLPINPAPRGDVKALITFEVDKDGILNVTARDESTGNEKSKRLDAPGKLSEAEIKEAVEKFEKNKSIDGPNVIFQIMINNANNAIKDAKDMISDSSLNDNEIREIEDLIDSLQEAIESNSKIQIPVRTTKLKKILMDLS